MEAEELKSILESNDIKVSRISGASKGAYNYILAETVEENIPSLIFYDDRIIRTRIIEK